MAPPSDREAATDSVRDGGIAKAHLPACRASSLLLLVSNSSSHHEAENLFNIIALSFEPSRRCLTTLLAPQWSLWGHGVVRKYPLSHGAQQHLVPERPFAAWLSAALWHRGAM
jgi:hypothetical protein